MHGAEREEQGGVLQLWGFFGWLVGFFALFLKDLQHRIIESFRLEKTFKIKAKH